MQLELAELDQVFTAKSIDRGVQDTCSTGSTGRISGIGITGTSTLSGTIPLTWLRQIPRSRSPFTA